MWAKLTDVSQQVEWYGMTLSGDEWKQVFTASVRGQKVVPGLDGEMVWLGASTTEMSTSEISKVIDCILAFGNRPKINVKWKIDKDIKPCHTRH